MALICHEMLIHQGITSNIIDLNQINYPKFDNETVYSSSQYLSSHKIINESDSLILCSPVYNWSICAELKNFIESIGSTPSDGSKRGALYDKIVTFVNNGGLPHSYMAFTSLANSLMLDFKCIINPYNIYTCDKHWHEDGSLSPEAYKRVQKSLHVAVELALLLKNRNYNSDWEV